MDVVLGMSVAPEAIHTVLVEGAGAGGVTVDQDDLRVAGTPSIAAATDLVIATVLRTRQAAAAGGYRLRSTGITCTDDAEAAALRDTLARRHIGDVTLVSAFTAAAALGQAVGGASGRARTVLLFVEAATATLAVVDTADGAAGIRRQRLARGDAGIAQLAAMLSGTASTHADSEEVFLVGSGVDIPSIRLALAAATPLSITVPEEPERALARGAALAAATAQLGAPPTLAIPSQDLRAAAGHPADAAGAAPRAVRGRGSRRSLAVAGAATAVLVAGVAALALVLALTNRPHSPAPPPAKTAPPALSPSATPPPPGYAEPSAAPVPVAPVPAAPAPGPTQAPQQGPPTSPGGDDHGGGAWIRRHLDRYGIPIPWP